MPYSIEVYKPGTGAFPQVVGSFSSATWTAFFEELGITQEQWRAWGAARKAEMRCMPILPEYPAISDLAYIQEDFMNFEPEQLRSECLRISSLMKTPNTQKLVADLIRAAEIAISFGEYELIVAGR